MTELVIQPSAKDTTVLQALPTSNYGADTYLTLMDVSTWVRRSILEFGISSLPAGATLTSASLQLYYYSWQARDPVNLTIWAYKLIRTNWVEAEAAWNIYKTGSNWTTAGGDYVTSSPVGGSCAVPASYGWMSFDVLAIVQDAYSAGIAAEFLSRYDNESLPSGSHVPWFYSKDEVTQTTLRPKLVINYTVSVTHEGAATLSGIGTLAGIGRGIFIGKATLSGIGNLIAAGRGIFTGVATLTGQGSLAALGALTAIGKTILSGIGNLSANAVLTVIGKATLSGIGSLAAIGRRIREGAIFLAGQGTLVVSGSLTAIGKVTLTGVGILTAIGQSIIIHFASAVLSGIGSLSARGSFWQYASATLSGIGTLHILIRQTITKTVYYSGRILSAIFPDKSKETIFSDKSADSISPDKDFNIVSPDKDKDVRFNYDG